MPPGPLKGGESPLLSPFRGPGGLLEGPGGALRRRIRYTARSEFAAPLACRRAAGAICGRRSPPAGGQTAAQDGKEKG